MVCFQLAESTMLWPSKNNLDCKTFTNVWSISNTKPEISHGSAFGRASEKVGWLLPQSLSDRSVSMTQIQIYKYTNINTQIQCNWYTDFKNTFLVFSQHLKTGNASSFLIDGQSSNNCRQAISEYSFVHMGSVAIIFTMMIKSALLVSV